MSRLQTACEKAKLILSTSNQTTVEVDTLFDGQDFNC
jgi:L1 cell adhesion molecule like protein